MKLALLSNVTLDVLARLLSEAGHDLWLAPGFDAWMETALEPPDALRNFFPDEIALLLDKRWGNFDPTIQSVETAVQRLQAVFPRARIVVPDLARLAADFGEAFYDVRLWQLARMPFSLVALHTLVKLFTLKKVLALDCDGVLWQGVVSEDGVEGVVMDTAFQQRVRALKQQGFLLVILSKNEAEALEPVWTDARMILKRDDFVAAAINWQAKSENLRELAKALNLDPSSFVFIDDNPGNRAEMRAHCPEVCVTDFPPQLECFLPPLPITEEDAHRTELYRAEAKRRASMPQGNLETYLASLDIVTQVQALTLPDCTRVWQLAQKTNQFNVTTHRYSLEEVKAWLAPPTNRVWIARARDRFGDLGLIAFVRVKDGEIIDWVMSCRAMNRRIEYDIEKAVEDALRAEGLAILKARYSPTTRNTPVADLFERFGFTCVAQDAAGKRYRKCLT